MLAHSTLAISNFGRVISTYKVTSNSFKSLDYKKNLKIDLSSVGKMFVVSALLRNAITCLYGNETSDYFGIAPPTLEQYFQ